MSTFLGILSLLLALGGGGLTLYYRYLWSNTRANLDTLTEAQKQWAAVTEAQAKQLDEARAQLQVQQETERRNDEAVVGTVHVDAGRAAELLNKLHP